MCGVFERFLFCFVFLKTAVRTARQDFVYLRMKHKVPEIIMGS